MEINESHSPVFNRPFVRITDGSEETGDYLFVDIEVRQAIALRDALLERYPLPVQPSALQRLEEENQELREQNKYLMDKCAPF